MRALIFRFTFIGFLLIAASTISFFFERPINIPRLQEALLATSTTSSGQNAIPPQIQSPMASSHTSPGMNHINAVSESYFFLRNHARKGLIEKISISQNNANAIHSLIYDVVGIPPQHQRLTLGGKALDGSLTWNSLLVPQGATVDMFIAAAGGVNKVYYVLTYFTTQDLIAYNIPLLSAL